MERHVEGGETVKQISIKTVDGNRYDYKESAVMSWSSEDWLEIKEGNTKILFFMRNIVSITEVNVEGNES